MGGRYAEDDELQNATDVYSDQSLHAAFVPRYLFLVVRPLQNMAFKFIIICVPQTANPPDVYSDQNLHAAFVPLYA